MHARAQRRFAGVAVLASIASVALAAQATGCSLGLDQSLIGADSGTSGDAMTSDGTNGDAPADAPTDGRHSDSPSDSPSDGQGPPGSDAGACTTDKDCQSAASEAAAGCVTSAKCDPTWHVCMLDVCKSTTACQSAVCIASTDTCSVPSTYKFQPAGPGVGFPVAYGGVGPGGPGASIAAVWPFVFVVTTNGVIAYDVIDPTSMPTVVSVHGVPFIPGTAIAVGRRVYFVRGPEGGPTYHYAIAWVDVPQNPFITQFTASSAWVSSMDKNFYSLYPDGVNGLFFVYNSSALWPTADLQPPLSDTTTSIAHSIAGFPMGANVWGTSGSRLFTGRYDGTLYGFWGALVNSVGTGSANATAEQMIGAGLGQVADQGYVATGADGSVLMSLAPYVMTDAGPNGIASACLTWLIDSSSAGNFDATKCFQLESYPTPPGGTVVGPPGWIDANTALGLAGAQSNPGASTSVYTVKKTTGVVAADVALPLTVGPGSVGVATSGGFGYALTQDDPMNQTCTVYVFAPGCK